MSASCAVEDLARPNRKGALGSTTDTRSAPEERLASRKEVLRGSRHAASLYADQPAIT
jgi:hypothetical protein